MLKTLLFSLILVGFSLAGEVDLSTPSKAVESYYDALNEADMNALQETMLEDSYDTDIQIYALSLALQDKDFHKVLKEYQKSDKAKKIVIAAVEQKLRNRQKKSIIIQEEIPLGKNRAMVKFTEDLQKKQLYLSGHENTWKIDYLAGRKIN